VIVVEPVRMCRSREVVIVEWTHTCHEERACRGHESDFRVRRCASRGLEIGVEARECLWRP
jgi:hypothetical protein